MSHSTEAIRNLALAGHPGTGKTTLSEALLHAGGAIATAGTIERGNTVSDHDPIERERGHSIDTALASFDHAGVHVNLIDTPGYPDFRGPALAALAAVCLFRLKLGVMGTLAVAAAAGLVRLVV